MLLTKNVNEIVFLDAEKTTIVTSAFETLLINGRLAPTIKLFVPFYKNIIENLHLQ